MQAHQFFLSIFLLQQIGCKFSGLPLISISSLKHTEQKYTVFISLNRTISVLQHIGFSFPMLPLITESSAPQTGHL